MAGAATTAAPFINLTRPPRSNLRRFSPNNIPYLRHQPFPSGFHHTRGSKPIISVCHSKLNSSDVGESHETVFDGYYGIEDESDDDDAESSVDLLIRFLQSMFKKVAKRAKKASRSVLPGGVISPQLVSFAVDGTLLLASLSVLKAFLEVICTLGGTVFAAILILRVIWSAVSYFQSSGSGFNQGGNSFGAVA